MFLKKLSSNNIRGSHEKKIDASVMHFFLHFRVMVLFHFIAMTKHFGVLVLSMTFTNVISAKICQAHKIFVKVCQKNEDFLGDFTVHPGLI